MSAAKPDTRPVKVIPPDGSPAYAIEAAEETPKTGPVDIVQAARHAFDQAETMLAVVDADKDQLEREEAGLIAQMDDLQQRYAALVPRLEEVRRGVNHARTAGEALAGAMDNYDEVLKQYGVER